MVEHAKLAAAARVTRTVATLRMYLSSNGETIGSRGVSYFKSRPILGPCRDDTHGSPSRTSMEESESGGRKNRPPPTEDLTYLLPGVGGKFAKIV